MARSWRHGCWIWLGSCLVSGAIVSLERCVFAQVTGDTDPSRNLGTLVNTLDSKNFQITGGTTVGGSNLFHGFNNFSIPNGGSAEFLNNTGIINIFARVTGGSRSDIQGLIKANANLFLINPYGISFGAGTQLNIRGSFVGTTANAIQFPNGGEFSMTSPVAPDNPLLQVNPSALAFNRIAVPEAVEVRSGANLKVGSTDNPSSLLVVGGSVLVDEGKLEGVAGSRVQLGGFTGAGNVELTFDSRGPSLLLPTNGLAGTDIRLINGAIVNVGSVSADAGNILIAGGTISIDGEKTQLSSSTFGTGDAGIVILRADDSVSITNKSAIFSTGEDGASGNAGGIGIAARSISLDGARLTTNNKGPGNAGAMLLKSRSQVSIMNSDITSTSSSNSTADFGAIQIEATEGSVFLNNSKLSTTNFGSGYAGDISISARDQISLSQGNLFSRGNLGRIIIGESKDYTPFSPKVVNIDSTQLNTDNSISGPSGNISAGGIFVQADDSISLTNGATLTSSTTRQGNAGVVSLKANGNVSLSNESAIFSIARTDAIGNAGGIFIQSGSLSINNGGGLTTETLGQGDAGIILLKVTNDISLIGNNTTPTGIFSSAAVGSSGQGGGIGIVADRLFIRDGARVSVDNGGAGPAGAILVEARRLILDNQGLMTAITNSGSGGDIDLTEVREYVALSRNSNISTTAGFKPAGGNGGNIGITTRFVVATPRRDSDITAQAYGNGDGGRIQVNAIRLFDITRRPENSATDDINASSRLGIDGTVDVNALDIDPSRALANLPAAPLPDLLARGCRQNGIQVAKDTFTVTRNGGLPPSPSDVLSNNIALEDFGSDSAKPSATSSTPAISSQQGVGEGLIQNSSSQGMIAQIPTEPVVQAQGWVREPNGDVVLTAQAPTVTPQHSWMRPIACHGS